MDWEQRADGFMVRQVREGLYNIGWKCSCGVVTIMGSCDPKFVPDTRCDHANR